MLYVTLVKDLSGTRRGFTGDSLVARDATGTGKKRDGSAPEAAGASVAGASGAGDGGAGDGGSSGSDATVGPAEGLRSTGLGRTMPPPMRQQGRRGAWRRPQVSYPTIRGVGAGQGSTMDRSGGAPPDPAAAAVAVDAAAPPSPSIERAASRGLALTARTNAAWPRQEGRGRHERGGSLPVPCRAE